MNERRHFANLPLALEDGLSQCLDRYLVRRQGDQLGDIRVDAPGVEPVPPKGAIRLAAAAGSLDAAGERSTDRSRPLVESRGVVYGPSSLSVAS